MPVGVATAVEPLDLSPPVTKAREQQDSCDLIGLFSRHFLPSNRDLQQRERSRQHEEARVKAEEAAKAQLRVDQEAAQLEAEEEAAVWQAVLLKGEQEEEARLKEEQEVARLKVEQEGAAARLKEEQEVARLKGEQEEAAARLKEEEEAAARLKEEEEEAARLIPSSPPSAPPAQHGGSGCLETEKEAENQESKMPVGVATAVEPLDLSPPVTKAREQQDSCDLIGLFSRHFLPSNRDLQQRERSRQHEEARVKAEEAAKAQLRVDQEAAQLEAEEEAAVWQAVLLKGEQEEEARLKEEQEVARLKVEQEGAAARLKEEQEVARLKGEQEEAAARLKEEEEAAARLKEEEEEAARLIPSSPPSAPPAQHGGSGCLETEKEAENQESKMPVGVATAVEPLDLSPVTAKLFQREPSKRQEAARLKAEEQEAARMKGEQEKAARVKEEQEAARVKAEEEEARVKKAKEKEVKAQEEAAKAHLKEEAAKAHLKEEEEKQARLNDELAKALQHQRWVDEERASRLEGEEAARRAQQRRVAEEEAAQQLEAERALVVAVIPGVFFEELAVPHRIACITAGGDDNCARSRGIVVSMGLRSQSTMTSDGLVIAPEGTGPVTLAQSLEDGSAVFSIGSIVTLRQAGDPPKKKQKKGKSGAAPEAVSTFIVGGVVLRASGRHDGGGGIPEGKEGPLGVSAFLVLVPWDSEQVHNLMVATTSCLLQQIKLVVFLAV